jgi:hypothetical protein
MDDQIAQFRAITEDALIATAQIGQFIEWGKGDLQHALNYYYQHLEKGKIKHGAQSNNQSNQLTKTVKPTTTPSLQPPPEPCEKEACRQEYSGRIDAFDVLKEGSAQYKKTHDFIREAREIYKLPINGKPQSELLANSSSCLAEHAGLIPEEFMMADCLAEAFNAQKLKQLSDNKPQASGSPHTARQHPANQQKPRSAISTTANERRSEPTQQMRNTGSFTDLENF